MVAPAPARQPTTEMRLQNVLSRVRKKLKVMKAPRPSRAQAQAASAAFAVKLDETTRLRLPKNTNGTKVPDARSEADDGTDEGG